MLNYEPFLGREYSAGRLDCYSVLRDFIAQEFQLVLPNFARPERFWEDPHLDLYGRYLSQGFKPVLDQPITLGDVLLMPIRTAINSHAAMVVDDNLILHHLPGRISSVDALYPRWARQANVVIRHPLIHTACHPPHVQVPFEEVVNVRARRYSEL